MNFGYQKEGFLFSRISCLVVILIVFLRIKNHLSNNQSSSDYALKSHRNQCEASRGKLYVIKKCRFNTETELMEAVPIKRLKPSLNIKLGHSQGTKSLLPVFH